jgi:hypothetical protein
VLLRPIHRLDGGGLAAAVAFEQLLSIFPGAAQGSISIDTRGITDEIDGP